jgi:hypothetical protein
MLFISYYYDTVYDLLESRGRIMKLKDIRNLIIMPNIDFERYIPRRYKDKMMVFKMSGEEYVFIPTDKMRKRYESSRPT